MTRYHIPDPTREYPQWLFVQNTAVRRQRNRIDTPRDRENNFELHLINKKYIKQMGSQTLSVYAKVMTTREIVATFKEMYCADASPTLISKVSDALKWQVTNWLNRQLDALYPIFYKD